MFAARNKGCSVPCSPRKRPTPDSPPVVTFFLIILVFLRSPSFLIVLPHPPPLSLAPSSLSLLYIASSDMRVGWRCSQSSRPFVRERRWRRERWAITRNERGPDDEASKHTSLVRYAQPSAGYKRSHDVLSVGVNRRGGAASASHLHRNMLDKVTCVTRTE